MNKEKLNIDIRQLDVTDDSSIQSLIQDILKTYQKIDILVNNADSGYLGTIVSDKPPCFRYQTSELSRKIANAKLTDPTGNHVIALSASRLPDVIEES